MTAGWRIDSYISRLTGLVVQQEVVPEKDEWPHESDAACECNPTVTVTNGVPMLIHNSFDSREKFESLRDQ